MANFKCIDVSEWQGNVDWKKVKASGVDYAILRAGFGREASQIDGCFEQNYKNAKAAGIKLGAYWYSYADSVADAKNEAAACLDVIKGKTFELPIYYDMEDGSQTGFSKDTLTSMAKAFCDTVKAKGYNVGVYANLNWFTNYLDYTELKKLYSIWLAQYNASAELNCDIWQYASDGKVNGVSGNADVNIIYNEKIIKTGGEKAVTTNFETAAVQALLRQAYAQDIVKTFIKPIDNKKGKLTNAAILEAKTALGLKNPDTTINLKFIVDLEHLVNVKREANFDKARGDVNEDGKVNIRDATALQKELAGID